MLIAVAADGNALDSPISEEFGTCRFLLLIETEGMRFEAIDNSTRPDGERLARMIVHRNCEALITGKLPSPVFKILADEGVTRYAGFSLDVKTAIQRMDKNALEYICYADGNETCEGPHHSCEGDHEECDGDCDACVHTES
jgi:predicted Fe-Mo cluster-binding NifX family protein